MTECSILILCIFVKAGYTKYPRDLELGGENIQGRYSQDSQKKTGWSWRYQKVCQASKVEKKSNLTKSMNVNFYCEHILQTLDTRWCCLI